MSSESMLGKSFSSHLRIPETTQIGKSSHYDVCHIQGSAAIQAYQKSERSPMNFATGRFLYKLLYKTFILNSYKT